MLASLLALATMVCGTATSTVLLRYKVEMTVLQERDMSQMGQGKSTGSATLVAYLSVALSDSASGQLAQVNVDSMILSSTGVMAEGYDPSLAAGAKGSGYHIYVVNGRMKGAATPSIAGNPALAMLGQGLAVLFPGTIRANLKVGDSYPDTTASSSTNEAGTTTTSTITTWGLKGVNGDEMLLEGNSTSKTSTEGGARSVTGTIVGKRTLVTTLKGPVKTATLTNKTDLEIAPAGMPVPYTVKSTISVTITQLN